MVPINYLAVLVAAVANMVLGSLWYGPLFGKKWMALSGINPETMGKKGMGKTYALAFGGSFLMAWVSAHVFVFAATYLNMWGPQSGLMAGFYNWLGFVVPVTLSSVLWEGKSWKLWCLNSSYYLIALVTMGLIIASWM